MSSPRSLPLVFQALRELRFAEGLSASSLTRLSEIAELRASQAGSILFREGAAADELCFVSTGRVALDMHVNGRGAVRILTVGAGEMLGWSAFVGGHTMTATATVVNDVQLVVIPALALRRLCETDHEVGYQIARQMAAALSKRLIATRFQLLDLFSHPDAALPIAPPERREVVR